MSESDKQLRDALSGAFDKVHAPEQLKMRTVEMIEAQRMRQTDGVVDQADATDGQADVDTSDAFRTSVAAGDAFQTDVADDASIPTKKKNRVITSLRAKIALAACAVLIALGIGGGAYAYQTPVAYVGIDINPSIELGVNYFDRVVSAEGVNADGQDILSETNVVGMSYEEALAALNDSLTNKGYLTADAAVAVTVMCDDDSRCSNLEETSQRCFSSTGQGVHCSRATSAEHHEAHESGLGMGKYLAWRSLVDAGVDISADDVAHMTMSELRALAAQEGVAIDQGAASQGASNQSATDQNEMNQGATDESTADQGETSQSAGNHDDSNYHDEHQQNRQGSGHHDESCS